MIEYIFGKRSKNQLSTCHIDLQLIMEESLKVSMVDFGASEGHRSTEKQKEFFDRGLSKIDGINKKGKHNFMPSMAVDIFAYIKGKPKLAYNITYLSYLGGVITATANRLLNEGRISHKIRWGGNFNRNSEILEQDFVDAPHYELEK